MIAAAATCRAVASNGGVHRTGGGHTHRQSRHAEQRLVGRVPLTHPERALRPAAGDRDQHRGSRAQQEDCGEVNREGRRNAGGSCSQRHVHLQR